MEMKAIFLIAMVLVFVQAKRKENREFWFKEGQEALKKAIKLRPNVGVAKNVIMFLGDGMGVPTITAARILKGQLNNEWGEETRLEMEKFPFTGLAKTYNTNQQTPDSAGTGTAYWSGVKTRYGVLGVDQTIEQGDCTNLETAKLKTILDWTLKEGKSVGIVSTARITHASPGAGYAKIPHRDWENDAEMMGVPGCEGVKDIARQLVENYHNVQVVMGGGRANFYNASKGGNRRDGRDLIQLWKDMQNAKGVKNQYVENETELLNIPGDTEYLFGLFNQDHMNYDAYRKENEEPSIAEMFEKAHMVLSKNPKGYFLFVEGGRIDHGHHKNLAHQALLETIAMDNAIGKAVELTDEKDTLIMVTADHSHVFVMAGYPPRGFPIVGKMTYNGDVRESKKPLDGKPMTVLMYANGPGPQRGKLDLSSVDTTEKDFLFPNAVPTKKETHGGEDVAVFARGPMSHLVLGVHEQNVLPHIMAYASCVGADKSLCDDQSVAEFCSGNGAVSSFQLMTMWVNVLCGFILAVWSYDRSVL